MKITRHAARDMRQALRAVREQLGPDAVILSSRRTPDGVEVTAAMDFDTESLIAEAERAAPPAPAPAPAAAPPSEPARTVQATVEPLFADEPQETAEAHSPNVLAMQTELKTLRHVLETQLARLAWSDLARRSPIQTEMLRELTAVGIAAESAAEIVASVPASAELTQTRRLTIAAIAQRLIVTGDRWLHEGGHIALVGPTGAGKSTTLAKLAVRWVLNHGPRDLALVAADTQRFGAHSELQALGQLLGAPVHVLAHPAELPELIARLSRCRCVLIDTAGVSPRDGQLASRLAALSTAGSAIEVALVVAASTQAGALADTVARFAPVNPTSCVLTKVDEAASLGGALSMLMRTRLPISYVSEGQRVPEDLRPARALELVSSAVQLARDAGAAADEDLLERRFGELAHALR
ncbi:MAG TPA: flagellar biosynthesis protein FlhF [Steroidobacteraceae bacterium]